jgi:prophage antirepressor-like protein
MNDLILFNFGDQPVRVIMRSGEPWWVLADVCRVLEHTDPSKAASRLDNDERGATIVRTPGGEGAR